MRKRGGGSIVNFYSIDVDVGAWLHADYNTAKAAILGLTRSAAAEWGRFNIRVNAILPGLIEGDRVRRVIAAKAKALSISEGEYEAELLRYTSMRTMVTAEDVASMALFLASDESSFVAGVDLDEGAALARAVLA